MRLFGLAVEKSDMEKKKKFNAISEVVCAKPLEFDNVRCYEENKNGFRSICRGYGNCRIWEKSDEQLSFVINSPDENCYLEACAGSGKTEVVGLKTAYLIKKWISKYAGIAVLTFTNNAADVISERISQITKLGYPHYVGTFSSWLHRYIANPFAHLITNYPGENGNRSIRVIEDSNQSDFLNAFKTKYQYCKTGYIHANEFFIDISEKNFYFSSSRRENDIIRNQYKFAEWEKRDLRQTKERFWKSGFATYQDIEYLCNQLLKKENAIELISDRFPLILVDECQDLSSSQIQILERLLRKGSHIELIGDLNQAIYSFRKVDPKEIEEFIEKYQFTHLQLTQNFRSLQPIVNLSGKIINQKTQIKGVDFNGDKPVCLYTEYKKEEINQLPQRFIDYLDKKNVDINHSAILTRSNNNIARLRPGIKSDIKIPMLLPIAIHIWKQKSLVQEQISEALNATGKFISYYYFGNQPYNNQNQCCPESVKSNIKWRIFLSYILDAITSDKVISNLDLSWETWSKNFRLKFPAIIERLSNKYDITINKNGTKRYSCPRDSKKCLSQEPIITTLDINNDGLSKRIRITNFHQIKGETLESAMIVSNPTNQGQSEGYWENWLKDPNEESARFAYVACTRPKKLLVWAVPDTLSLDDKKKLADLGLEIENEL